MKEQITTEIKFQNDFFKCEKAGRESIIITILKDKYNFFGVNLDGCKFITDNNGYIADKFTDKAISDMINHLYLNNSEFKNLDEFKVELRNRMLNVLISQIPLK